MSAPFGGVAFDPALDSKEGPSNGERANMGKAALAAMCFVQTYPMARAIHVNDIDLTEATDEAVVDLIVNLMHFCHREGISWTNRHGVLLTAVQHFREESGGAIL